MYNNNISRRTFIRSAVATTAVFSTTGPALGALGANERIAVGVIGTGGRGDAHLKLLKQQKDVEVVAVCDVDRSRMEGAAGRIESNPKQFNDFRRLLELKEVDAVFVITPGHWHAIPTIQAMQAGKDVYVEKAMGHTVHEGRVIVDKTKQYNRVLQVGTQHRSQPHWINAVKRIQAGELGQITTVNVWNAWNRKEMGGDLGHREETDPPPGVDYDMWLGPAPKHPYTCGRFHFYFYFFWDYSGGMVSAWGVHLFDVVMWAMGYNIKSVSANGGIYVLKGDRETPDTVQAVFDCGNYVMTYSLRHNNGWRLFGNLDHGIEFIGTEGVLQINRGGFQMYHEADRGTRKPYYSEKPSKGDGTFLNHRNFFECVRSRKPNNADALAGHLGAIPGHLANISYRVGRGIRWDAEKETIIQDTEAAKLLTKEYREPWNL